MRRRNFIAAAGGAAVAALTSTAAAAPRRIGIADVQQFEARFGEVVASDHRHGGRLSIETRASQLTDEALTLQKFGTATQRIRAAGSGPARTWAEYAHNTRRTTA